MKTRICFVAVLFWLAVVDLSARSNWISLTNCQLVSNPANGGDSFHVTARGKQYLFRLYFVDAPETDLEFPDRVNEQAKYFGITREQTIKVGKLAEQFTRQKLTQPFPVRTFSRRARPQQDEALLCDRADNDRRFG